MEWMFTHQQLTSRGIIDAGKEELNLVLVETFTVYCNHALVLVSGHVDSCDDFG